MSTTAEGRRTSTAEFSGRVSREHERRELDRVRQLVAFRSQPKETVMGAIDKAKDKAQAAKGTVKEKAGKATNDRSLEAKGKGDKASGNLKQAGEKVKDAL
jgi:uncharacterized protein YjbJ (UPF0337 family)